VKPLRRAATAARASACIRIGFTQRSTIELSDMHSRPVRLSHTALRKQIVSGLPLGGDHPMHPFIINAEGSMYVDGATATNGCQLQNRQPGSPGANTCTELETRGESGVTTRIRQIKVFTGSTLCNGDTQCRGFRIRYKRQTLRDPTRA
jgi:hypothetical protein